jgi:serine/threonine-protein kinase
MSLVGRRIGNYEIKAKIGEGGMGAVYLGEHPLIGKRVAVKVLLEELAAKEDIVARFFNEAKAVNDIGHANIVDIVDFGRAPGEAGTEVVYFIMEFLDGESLSARIRRAGLPFKDTLAIMAQCCSALAASHAKGIVHRDLKPENIYLIPRGNDRNFVKVLDFGIAKLTGDGGSSSHKTRTGLVIGTPTYMSPEQCEGKGLIDHRSDVYSLGILMFELLTGVVPFPGEGFGEILVAHLTRQPPRPTDLNKALTPQLEAIVLHAIEKDRNRRFQNMDEFLRAIDDPEAHYRSWRALPNYSDGPTLSGPAAASSHAPGPGAPASVGKSPRPTTLEGAAAEVTHPPRRAPRRRAPLIATVSAVAVVIVGGAVVGVTQFGSPTTSAVAPPPDPRPPLPAPVASDVKVTIVTEPPGAKVTRADKSEPEAERTPITFRLKNGEPSFDVELRLEGYLPQRRTISSDETVKMVVTLVRQPTIPATPRPETDGVAVKKGAGGKSGSASVTSGSSGSKPKTKKKPVVQPGEDDIITPNFGGGSP